MTRRSGESLDTHSPFLVGSSRQGGRRGWLEPRDQPGKFRPRSERLQIGVCPGDPGGKACPECKLEKLDRPRQRARVVCGFGVDGKCAGGVVQALGGWHEKRKDEKRKDGPCTIHRENPYRTDSSSPTANDAANRRGGRPTSPGRTSDQLPVISSQPGSGKRLTRPRRLLRMINLLQYAWTRGLLSA